jgi:hypothetical protein
VGVPDDYPDRGLYSNGIYIDKGVFINLDGFFKIDLIHPENTYIAKGSIKSADGNINIDLTTPENTLIKKGII